MPKGIRLLVVTQAVDLDDPLLGFFHGWLVALAERVEKIEVICLKKGRSTLPANVRVHSLGKEQRPASAFTYALRFMRLVWRLRHTYNSVFVHMNEEYVLLAGWWWRLRGVRTVLWRNHKMGSWRTRIAMALSSVICHTSPEAFVARSPKAVRMPIGIDTDLFCRKPEIRRVPGTILFLGRISPVKHVDAFVRALAELKRRGVPFTARIVGDPTPRDVRYAHAVRTMVQTLTLDRELTFEQSVRHEETAALYASSDIYVNLTPEGSMDKTIFEAMACETPVLVANRALEGQVDGRCILGDPANLASRLADFLVLPTDEKESLAAAVREYVVRQHSLTKLIEALVVAVRQAIFL